MPTVLPVAIDEEQAAFLQAGVSITVGACNSENIPSVARALGCKVSSDRQRITLYLSRIQAADVLRDIASNRAIAVVFSAPPTHRTIQVKGIDAIVVDADGSASEIVEKHRNEFSSSLATLGFSPAIVDHLLACPDSELVGITFSPSAAFSQTPGPKAGESLSVRT